MVRVKKQPKCSICRNVPRPDCDYRQGRCPHRPAILELTFINRIINFFKGNNESSRSKATQKHKSSKKRI